MLRRNLLHIRRHTMGAGLPGQEGGGDRADYLVFITPGILIMTVASVARGTAISTATDMTTRITARFRTMDIARVSALTWHVLSAVIKTGVIVVAFAFLLGFRSGAGLLGWLGAIGLLVLIAGQASGTARRAGPRHRVTHQDTPLLERLHGTASVRNRGQPGVTAARQGGGEPRRCSPDSSSARVTRTSASSPGGRPVR